MKLSSYLGNYGPRNTYLTICFNDIAELKTNFGTLVKFIDECAFSPVNNVARHPTILIWEYGCTIINYYGYMDAVINVGPKFCLFLFSHFWQFLELEKSDSTEILNVNIDYFRMSNI